MLNKLNVNDWKTLHKKIFRVFNNNNEMLGLMNYEDLKTYAERDFSDFDILILSEKDNNMVVKFYDYNKYVYEQNKKLKEQKKNSAIIKIKEVQFHIFIDEHDFMLKIKKIKDFVNDGFKVKASIYLRGRERGKTALAEEMMNRIISECDDICTTSDTLKIAGNSISIHFIKRKI